MKDSLSHSMKKSIFDFRSGVVFQNRTDQVISYILTNVLMRAQLSTNLKKSEKTRQITA